MLFLLLEPYPPNAGTFLIPSLSGKLTLTVFLFVTGLVNVNSPFASILPASPRVILLATVIILLLSDVVVLKMYQVSSFPSLSVLANEPW